VSLADPPPVLAVTPTAAPLLDPLFISDLHLAAERPRTIARFLKFLASDAPAHRELVILGDLFEFWIGDDAAASARPIVDALATYSASGRRLLLMHGNRDPLLGHAFAGASGGTLLADPIVVEVAGTPTLLSHGDAWCTLDVAYQRFRAMVREPGFQRDFLSKSLDERIAFARGLRMQSDSEKSTKAADIMDVTPDAVVAALRATGVSRIIHGHTHRPAAHVIDLGDELAERWVLPDWDLDGAEPRGGFLEIVEGRPRLVYFD
jgi:UDP-2,3-diacylglucosamine hydrolase